MDEEFLTARFRFDEAEAALIVPGLDDTVESHRIALRCFALVEVDLMAQQKNTRKSKFTGEQIAFVLKQAELGTGFEAICRKRA